MCMCVYVCVCVLCVCVCVCVLPEQLYKKDGSVLKRVWHVQDYTRDWIPAEDGRDIKKV